MEVTHSHYSQPFSLRPSLKDWMLTHTGCWSRLSPASHSDSLSHTHTRVAERTSGVGKPYTKGPSSQANRAKLTKEEKQHPSIYPSINLSIYTSLHLYIYLSLHPSIYLSIHPSMHPSIYPSFNQSGHIETVVSFPSETWPRKANNWKCHI